MRLKYLLVLFCTSTIIVAVFPVTFSHEKTMENTIRVEEKGIVENPSNIDTASRPLDALTRDAQGLVIYLTFDDGPHHTTPGVVALLRRKNAKASFFIIGSQRDRVPAFDSIYRAMVDDTLFRFYNHSYSHAISGGRLPRYYSRPDSVYADIEKNRKYIPESARHIRFPGKNTWHTSHRTRMDYFTAPVIQRMTEHGNTDRVIGWDVSWKDTKGKRAVDALINDILRTTKRHRTFNNHVVVLCHDYQFRRKESLDDLAYMIDVLRNEHGCMLAWAEEYPW
ncbi:MAG: polysaccharide deacetylase family protein [Bacteroidota bacterium]